MQILAARALYTLPFQTLLAYSRNPMGGKHAHAMFVVLVVAAARCQSSDAPGPEAPAEGTGHGFLLEVVQAGHPGNAPPRRPNTAADSRGQHTATRYRPDRSDPDSSLPCLWAAARQRHLGRKAFASALMLARTIKS